MKLKKFGVSFGIAVIALVIPFTSVFAASGWQYIGSYYTYTMTDSGKYRTPIFKSGGGYIKICAQLASTGKKDFILYENDPGSGNDKRVGTAYLSHEQCTTFYVAPYVDGDNKKAELYIATSTNTDLGVKVWD